MQQQRGGHASGQRAIDGLVLVIEGVNHHHLRGDRAGGFVHIVIERDVRVRVDDAGSEIFPSRIDDRRAGRRIYVLTDRGDLAVFDVDDCHS